MQTEPEDQFDALQRDPGETAQDKEFERIEKVAQEFYAEQAPKPKEPTIGGELPDPNDPDRPTFGFTYWVEPKHTDRNQPYWEGVATFGQCLDPNEDTFLVRALTQGEVELALAEWAIERAKKEDQRLRAQRVGKKGKMFVTVSNWFGEDPILRYG